MKYVLMHDWSIDDICVVADANRQPMLFDTKEEAEAYGEDKGLYGYAAERYEPSVRYLLDCDLRDERG